MEMLAILSKQASMSSWRIVGHREAMQFSPLTSGVLVIRVLRSRL